MAFSAKLGDIMEADWRAQMRAEGVERRAANDKSATPDRGYVEQPGEGFVRRRIVQAVIPLKDLEEAQLESTREELEELEREEAAAKAAAEAAKPEAEPEAEPEAPPPASAQKEEQPLVKVERASSPPDADTPLTQRGTARKRNWIDTAAKLAMVEEVAALGNVRGAIRRVAEKHGVPPGNLCNWVNGKALNLPGTAGTAELRSQPAISPAPSSERENMANGKRVQRGEDFWLGIVRFVIGQEMAGLGEGAGSRAARQFEVPQSMVSRYTIKFRRRVEKEYKSGAIAAPPVSRTHVSNGHAPTRPTASIFPASAPRSVTVSSPLPAPPPELLAALEQWINALVDDRVAAAKAEMRRRQQEMLAALAEQ